MTKKRPPRSPSQFLRESDEASELWECVNTAGAFEHHRIAGKRHYIGFVDTAELLRHRTTHDLIAEKLCQKIANRSGVPDVVLIPPSVKAGLFGKCLLEGFRRVLGVRHLRLERAHRSRQTGHLALNRTCDLTGLRVLVGDAAAGHGDTLDELALLSSARAQDVAGAVLLSRLSEHCEQAFDHRLSGGFTRLFSMPVRPVTVRDEKSTSCPVCQRRRDLKDAIADLPRGRVREVATRLAKRPRFRRAIERERGQQESLFPISPLGVRRPGAGPLNTCKPSVASGITLHALHAAMNDGMAPLVLPEISSEEYSNVRRAALVADLPAEVLKWSGQPLVDELCAFLRNGRDKSVWMATVELMCRAGSIDWVPCLNDALEHGRQWMDDRFWAWLILVVHRTARSRPETCDQMRPLLLGLVHTRNQSPEDEGLEGMLAAIGEVSSKAERPARQEE